eukprot:TRINITY_DN57198_c0_g1_i1.p1 TRINITY_DN57198_c0_g1~~TRINITY_DN57198_c0_g1_i1.p1  ORF type:complete len:268 (+),score=65.82 TRINITY_DN57198_c0_g1_i1:69-806(+)
MPVDEELAFQVFREHAALNQKVHDEAGVRLFSFGYALFECPPSWRPKEFLAVNHVLVELPPGEESVDGLCGLIRVPLDDLQAEQSELSAAVQVLAAHSILRLYCARVVPSTVYVLVPSPGLPLGGTARSNTAAVGALSNKIRDALRSVIANPGIGAAALAEALGGPPRRAADAAALAVHSTLRTAGELGLQGEPCAVCLSDLSPESEVRRLRCMHAYHVRCVDRWLQEADSCPTCKRPVVPPADG